MPRLRKPDHLKVIQGTARADRANEAAPKPQSGVPQPPSELTDEGLAAWDALVEVLEPMGVLTVADGFALARGAEVYGEILRYQRAIKDAGSPTYDATGGSGATLIRAHPAVAMLADADRRFRAWLGEFGLTPASRSKVNVNGEDEAAAKPAARYFC